MTEEDARAWITAKYSGESVARLERFHDILVAESAQHNLIAPSTVPIIWSRHLLDSAQLLDHAPPGWQHWVDIGSGAGLPGLVIAILTDRNVTLVEPRRLRVDFLNRCCDALRLGSIAVLQARAETADIDGPVDIVSARAVGTLGAVFTASQRFVTRATHYILPKGESANSEVATVQRSWQGVFHVEQSIVDPKSGIVVATGVARR